MAWDLDLIKERLLISGSDYDTPLSSAIDEAVRLVVQQIVTYDATFTGSSEYIAEGTMLWDAVLDIAAGIFKRRHMPQDMDQGWWAQGLKKLEIYINSMYRVGTVFFVGIDEA